MTAEEAAALRSQLADAQAKLDAAENARVAAESKAEETTKLAKAEADRIAKAEQEIVDLRKAHAEEVEKREIVEFEKRAEREFPNVPGTAAAKGAQLRAIVKMEDGPAKDALLATLKAADGAFAGLMTSVGKAGVPVEGTATEELTRKAADLRKADAKLTVGAAMTAVMSSDPELATRYHQEVRGRG